jgi:hypothetical protein
VDIDLDRAPGCTWQSAELDDLEDLGRFSFEIQAQTKCQAKEKALDEFHGRVAIGALDEVVIETNVQRIK